MPRDSIQPFSRRAWEEKRRRWAMEQEQKRRGRMRILAGLGLFAVIAGLTWAYIVTPPDWKEQAGRFARKVGAIAGRLANDQ